jgi:hypothetical protein
MIMAILPIWAAYLLNTRQVHFFQSLDKGNPMSGTIFDAISDVVHTSQAERNDVTFSRVVKRTPISARLIFSTFLAARLPLVHTAAVGHPTPRVMAALGFRPRP